MNKLRQIITEVIGVHLPATQLARIIASDMMNYLLHNKNKIQLYRYDSDFEYFKIDYKTQFTIENNINVLY